MAVTWCTWLLLKQAPHRPCNCHIDPVTATRYPRPAPISQKLPFNTWLDLCEGATVALTH